MYSHVNNASDHIVFTQYHFQKIKAVEDGVKKDEDRLYKTNGDFGTDLLKHRGIRLVLAD